MFTCCNKQALSLGFFVLGAWFTVEAKKLETP